MKLTFLSAVVILFFAGSLSVTAQVSTAPDTIQNNILLEKQWSIGALLHTNGWGLKFRKGRNATALRQNMWEVEFATYKSSKEIRSINPTYPDSRSFFYGKLNYVWFLRGGIGQQRILNRKPYWGGVQLSWIYYGGFSLAVTKPVYLYIIYQSKGHPDEFREEQYNPEKHFLFDIYGRGSFLAGFSKIGFHPGGYIKTGLEFEFGAKDRQITALEVGGQFDYSPMPVPIMAYNPEQSYFLTLYISIMVGKRYNN